MVLVIIYSFFLDDSLNSERFTTRTEQLTKCCVPLQKLRVRLGACETLQYTLLAIINFDWILLHEEKLPVELLTGLISRLNITGIPIGLSFPGQ